jgi:hypothetical protein
MAVVVALLEVRVVDPVLPGDVCEMTARAREHERHLLGRPRPLVSLWLVAFGAAALGHPFDRAGDDPAASRVDAVLGERKASDPHEPGISLVAVGTDGGRLDEPVDTEAALQVGVGDLVALQPAGTPTPVPRSFVQPFAGATDDDADAVSGKQQGTDSERGDHVAAFDRCVEHRPGHQNRSSPALSPTPAAAVAAGWATLLVCRMARAPLSASTERIEVGTSQQVVIRSGSSAAGMASSPRDRRNPMPARPG